jgi:NADH-quinone oxidoreductase subunit G
VPEGPAGPFETGTPAPVASPNGALRLGTFRSIWAAPEVEASPALKFLSARAQVEVSPADADRLGLEHGERVTVSAGGRAVEACVALRGNAPAGTVFLGEGLSDGGASELTGDAPRLVSVTPARERVPAGVGAEAAAHEDGVTDEEAGA